MTQATATDPTDLPPRRHGVQALQLGQPRGQQQGQQHDTGNLWLPVCQQCGTVCYPLRELCVNCLSPELDWQPVPATGTLLAITTIHHSNEAHFRPQLPLRIGSVKLDAGPVAVLFVDAAQLQGGDRVSVHSRMDAGAAAVLYAVPAAAPSV